MSDCRADHWTPEGFYIHYGKKYATSKTGGVVCLGPVDPPTPVLTPLTGDKDVQEVVSKPPDDKCIEETMSQNQTNGVVMKHSGGRPRKTEGELSRTTVWRRAQEEKQLAMIID